MQQFKTTAVHILPSYALRLSMFFDEIKLDPRKDLSLRIAFVGAEPHTEETRRKIEALYGIKVYNSYGLSEMCGPGVAFECESQSGMHIWEDQFIPEIIDPVHGRRAARRGVGRAGADLARSDGPRRSSATGRATSRGSSPGPAPAGGPTGASTGSGAGPTTC